MANPAKKEMTPMPDPEYNEMELLQSGGDDNKELLPLRLILPKAAIQGIMATTYLSSFVGFDNSGDTMQQLPNVVHRKTVVVDLSVAFRTSPAIIEQLQERGEEMVDDEDSDDEDDDEDEAPTPPKNMTARQRRRWEKEQAKAQADKPAKADKPISNKRTFELEEGLELIVYSNQPGDAVLVVRDAGMALIPSDELPTPINQCIEYRRIAKRSEEAGDRLDNFLDGLGNLLSKLNEEPDIASLAGLRGADDTMLSSPEARTSLAAAVNGADDVNVRRATARREDLTQTYRDRLAQLGSTLFKNSNTSEPKLMTNAEIKANQEACDSAYISAMNTVISNVSDY